MGASASQTSALLATGLGKAGRSVSFPCDKADAACDWAETVRKGAFATMAETKTLACKVRAHRSWESVVHAVEIVNQAEVVVRSARGLNLQWQLAALKIQEVNRRIEKPHVVTEVLEGTTGGAAGIVLALLGAQKTAALTTALQAFANISQAMQNEAYTPTRVVRECAASSDHAGEDNVVSMWKPFLESMLKSCGQLLKALDPLLEASYDVRSVLKKFTQSHPQLKTKKEDAWAMARAKYQAGYNVALTAFPTVAGARKRQITGASQPPAKRRAPALALATLQASNPADARKKTLLVAQKVTYEEISSKLAKEVSAMKGDNTKFQSVLNSVQHVTPAAPDADGGNVWDQFETVAQAVRDWAINFVVALQDAPIQQSTRRETFEAMQSFYGLLQDTSLRLQRYRLYMEGVRLAISNVHYVLTIPSDVQESLSKLPTDADRLKKLREFADSNQAALATSLKKLQELLRNESGLQDLLDLHGSWLALNSSIQGVQVDVKHDIAEFKKKMRTIGWVSMGITAVVGIAVVIGTLGAAGPEVAAVAGEEIAEQAAIESAEVGTEVAMDSMIDGAVESAVEAGEVEAEAEAATTGATGLFSSIAEGLGKISTVASLSTGAKELVDKLMNEQLDAIKGAVSGLQDLQENANLIEVMLLYIYKDWAKIETDPAISSQSPMKPVYEAWNMTKIAPLMNALNNSMTTIEEVKEKVRSAEEHIDNEIRSFNSDVYQPLLGIFG